MIACLEQRFLPDSEAAVAGSGTGVDDAREDEEDLALLRGLELQGSVELVSGSCPPAGRDFGGIYHLCPLAVVRPSSAQDVAAVVRLAARSNRLTVAARGNGHSIYGQAMAPGGVVLEMRPFMTELELVAGAGDTPAVRAGGGALWEEVLEWCVRNHGLAPRSWTDYLGLTIGGTLSVGGISGQAFRFGPQTSNVVELEVVTGVGDTVVCSNHRNPDLFFAVLGGLGQFGVITRATIPLQQAPDMVRWMRLVYAEFEEYAGDAEWLVSRAAAEAGGAFDYVEGFAFANSDDPVNGWDSVPLEPGQRFDPSGVPAGAGPVLYCLEVAIHHDGVDVDVDERGVGLLRRLRYVRGLEFRAEVSYVGFLSRVKRAEEAAKAGGIWDGAPHPWLNLLISKADIADFDCCVFKRILRRGVGGPMLVYPLLRSRWDPRSSVAAPAGEVFYLVALLRFNRPFPEGPPAEQLLAQNREVVDVCAAHGYDFKLYIPHHRSRDQWRRHFGDQWARFVERKARYDPMAVLSPGQGIFSRCKEPLQKQET